MGKWIYYKNPASTPKYPKAASTTSNDWTNAVYDQDLKFAYISNVIYVFQTNDYTSIVSGLTGIKTEVKLISNKDANKLLMLTYTTSSPFTYDVRLWTLNAGTWTESATKVASATIAAVTPFPPTVITSPDFETIGVGYIDGATPAPSGVIKKIVYGSPITITEYSGPIELISLTNMPLFIFSNNFFYFRSN